MSLKEIPITDFTLNPVTTIGGDWMLITAGNEQHGYNTMTAAWGHLGAIWHLPGREDHLPLPTAVVYIRPQRYTKEFVDREPVFTLSVLPAEYKKALGYLGSHSGRDGDKVAAAELMPVFAEDTTWFAEARLVLVCRKLYHAPLLESGFVDREVVERNYPDKDFHEMYVGEIMKILRKE